MSREWERKGGAPVLEAPRRLSLDNIFSLLGSTVLRPGVALALLPALLYRLDKRATSFPLAPHQHTSERLAYIFGKKHRWASWLAAFVAIKTVHSFASRYVKNNGAWQRDPPDWEKEVVVVTGGSSGIGRAIVEILSHKYHASIAVLDLAEPTYAAAPAGAPEILYIKTNVTDPKAIQAAAQQIREHFRRDVTYLINNAGITKTETILDADLSVVEKHWRIMTLAHWITLKEFLPAMIRANHGHVVSIASAASYMALPQGGAYSGAKAAALSLHETLHGELRARYDAPRVRASVVCPTKVQTLLAQNLESQENAFLTPDLEPVEVGLAVADALNSGLSQHIIRPAAMNILPFVSRGPAWLKRIIELIGHTDHNFTDAANERSRSLGYKIIDS